MLLQLHHHHPRFMVALVCATLTAALRTGGLASIEPNSFTDLVGTHTLLDEQHHKVLYIPSEPEYLDEELAEAVCSLGRGADREKRLRTIYLGFCSRYNLDLLLSTNMLDRLDHFSTEVCLNVTNYFLQKDRWISTYYQAFNSLLQRYNCQNGYSVKWNCDDCQKAYKDWLCAINLTVYMGGELIKPCISICERVEQRCPYLLPITKEQYGGQPVFICRDPNIPFVPEITPDIPYSEPFKCYDLCHLRKNESEIAADSLSIYKNVGCPKNTELGVNVRNSCNNRGEHKKSVQFHDDNYKIGPIC